MATLGIFASQIGIPAQVAAPEMTALSPTGDGFYTYRWYVTNKDPLSVTIYSEAMDASPDVSRGTIAPGASTSTISASYAQTSRIAYAQAVAISPDSRPSSIIVSVYMEAGGIIE